MNNFDNSYKNFFFKPNLFNINLLDIKFSLPIEFFDKSFFHFYIPYTVFKEPNLSTNLFFHSFKNKDLNFKLSFTQKNKFLCKFVYKQVKSKERFYK